MTIYVSTSLILGDLIADPNAPVVGWHNLVPLMTVSGSSEQGSYPLSNLQNPSTFLKWKGSNTGGTENIVFPTPGSYLDDIDYVGIAGHNFGSGEIPITITARLGGIDTTYFSGVTVNGDDPPLIFRLPAAQYERVDVLFSAPASPSTNISAGVFYIGKLLTMQRRMYVGHTPINYGRQSNVINGMSNNGNFLGRVTLQEKRKSSASFNNITPAWYRQNIEPFAAAAVEDPFFFAWRPQTYPDEVGYCWLTSDIVPSNAMSNGMMQFGMEYEGIAR